ncbi:MAG: hypothetical protein GQ534_12040 [Candidatus Delongbacteria bacterium]|nr:hypothetical protein [Candidatus Delongbacteria bacterium]
MKKYLFLLIVLVLFFSCENDTSSPDEDQSVDIKLDGFIQKGPFITGSEITIQELNSSLVPNGDIYKVTTEDNFGSFTLEAHIPSKYLEIISTGFYYNEVTGELSDANLTLRTIVEKSDTLSCNVNVLTSLAKKRIVYLFQNENKTFEEAQLQAQDEILSIFNINEENVIDFHEMDISSEEENNGILLALSAILQGSNTVSELSLLVSTIVEDIKEDGILDDQDAKTEIIENAKYLSLLDVRNNVETYYQSLGLALTVPDFESYVRNLWVNTPPTCNISKLESEIIVFDMFNPIDTLSVFNNDTLYMGSEIDIQVLAEDNDGYITKVETYLNDCLIDDTSFGSFSWVITDTTKSNIIKVIAYDDDGETCADSMNFMLHGTTWKEVGINPSNDSRIYGCSYDNKLWIKTRYTKDLWYSEDCNTWVKTSSNVPWDDHTFEMLSFKDTLWAFDNSVVYNSIDGITWNTLPSSISWSWSSFSTVVYDGKIWLCDGSTGKLWNSIDGINWNFITIIADDTTISPKLFVFNNKLWFTKGYSIMNSTNGISWNSMSDLSVVPKDNFGSNLCANNDKIYYMDINYNLWSSEDGDFWIKEDISFASVFSKQCFLEHKNKIIGLEQSTVFELKKYFD